MFTKALQAAKQQLSSIPVLVDYNQKLKIRLAGDVSRYKVGAVLSYVLPNSTEHPVVYASQTLKLSNNNYARLEKKALSLIYGIRKFHKYIYGCSFTLVTDHRTEPSQLSWAPRLAFLPSQPFICSAGLCYIISGYKHTVQFRATQAHTNADGLSWLPVPMPPVTEPEKLTLQLESIFTVSQLQALPVSVAQLRRDMHTDSILGRF